VTPETADALRRAAAHVLVEDVESPVLSDQSTVHVFRSLRVRIDELVTVTDGAGRWRRCRAGDDAIAIDGDVTFEPRRANPVTIGVAIPKLDRPEWIVQKLTELGVDRIVFLHADRSVVRWDPDRASKHVAKLRRVAAEALQQSRGVWLPEIDGPVSSHVFLQDAVVAEPGCRALGSSDHVVAIGPEGGWSTTELSLAKDRASLGRRVLRVETASLVAAAHLTAHAG
jgi:16S rRNA (uracil1498-N3)-methyltransferase